MLNCSKRTTVICYSTVGSDAMHQYKPGTAIGSTGGRGSARNQRERLRTQPPALLDPHLLPNVQRTYMRLSRSRQCQAKPPFIYVLPSPSRLN